MDYNIVSDIIEQHLNDASIFHVENDDNDYLNNTWSILEDTSTCNISGKHTRKVKEIDEQSNQGEEDQDETCSTTERSTATIEPEHSDQVVQAFYELEALNIGGSSHTDTELSVPGTSDCSTSHPSLTGTLPPKLSDLLNQNPATSSDAQTTESADGDGDGSWTQKESDQDISDDVINL